MLCGITFTLMGVDDPFGKFPRHVALLAGCAAAMGGKDSVVNLCLHVISVTFLIPGVFLMCCFISTSVEITMGTN
jgi:Na+/H+ antiporter NhaC